MELISACASSCSAISSIGFLTLTKFLRFMYILKAADSSLSFLWVTVSFSAIALKISATCFKDWYAVERVFSAWLIRSSSLVPSFELSFWAFSNSTLIAVIIFWISVSGKSLRTASISLRFDFIMLEKLSTSLISCILSPLSFNWISSIFSRAFSKRAFSIFAFSMVLFPFEIKSFINLNVSWILVLSPNLLESFFSADKNASNWFHNNSIFCFKVGALSKSLLFPLYFRNKVFRLSSAKANCSLPAAMLASNILIRFFDSSMSLAISLILNSLSPCFSSSNTFVRVSHSVALIVKPKVKPSSVFHPNPRFALTLDKKLALSSPKPNSVLKIWLYCSET